MGHALSVGLSLAVGLVISTYIIYAMLFSITANVVAAISGGAVSLIPGAIVLRASTVATVVWFIAFEVCALFLSPTHAAVRSLALIAGAVAGVPLTGRLDGQTITIFIVLLIVVVLVVSPLIQ